MDGADIAGVDLTGIDLRGAVMKGVIGLGRAKLDNLQGAIMDGADVTGVDFRGADLMGGLRFGGIMLDSSVILDTWDLATTLCRVLQEGLAAAGRRTLRLVYRGSRDGLFVNDCKTLCASLQHAVVVVHANGQAFGGCINPEPHGTAPLPVSLPANCCKCPLTAIHAATPVYAS